MRRVLMVLGALILGLASAAADSVYTETSKCRAADGAADEFIKFCRGPGGYALVLHYFDGRAAIQFGPGSGPSKDEVKVTSEFEPIEVSATASKVFGDRAEWVLDRQGKPCAAIIRVYTPKSSVLVVRTPGGAERHRTNEKATAAAITLCKATSTVPSVKTVEPVSSDDNAALSNVSVDALIGGFKGALKAICTELGGSEVEYLKDFETRGDLNGDGVPDVLLSGENAYCVGHLNAFGGSLGKSTRILLSQGGRYHAVDGIFREPYIEGDKIISFGRDEICKPLKREKCEIIFSFSGVVMKEDGVR